MRFSGCTCGPTTSRSCGLGVSLLATAGLHRGADAVGRAARASLAGLFDMLDGSLARASGRVTPFGAFLDSVIDRYSDLVVLLGIVVLFARTPNERGALVAMAGLVGSVMVSYTKARAESIGVSCTVGFMERPERMICLIVGALFDLLEPALWVLADPRQHHRRAPDPVHVARDIARPRSFAS